MNDSSQHDDFDALCLKTTDRQAILEALDRACAEENLVRAPAQRLQGYGHFHDGEEDPSLRRFLVSPPSDQGWIVVLLSAQDWDHAWIPKLLAYLRVPAAYLMLHDGDTCTLHVYDGPEELAALITSPAHFDLPPMPRDPRLRSALEFLAGRKLSDAEVEECCWPPGLIDIDGRLAHRRIRELLRLPDGVLGTYGLSLETDGRTPAESHADWIHACWQDAEDAKSDEAFERAMADRGASADTDADGDELDPDPDTGSTPRDTPGTLLPFRRPEPS